MRSKALIWVVVILIIAGGLLVGKLVLNGKQGTTTSTSQTPTSTSSTEEGNPDAWNTYVSTKEGYKISYPPEFSLKDDNIYLNDQMATGTEIDYPSKYTTGTNLSQAYIGITRKLVEGSQNCYAPISGSISTSTVTTTINGVTFRKIDETGAAAGNYYEDLRYATLKGNYCYNVALFMHSTQRLNYPVETRPAEFDRNSVVSIFDEIMKTFKLL